MPKTGTAAVVGVIKATRDSERARILQIIEEVHYEICDENYEPECWACAPLLAVKNKIEAV
jgi:hypothetical protein